MSRLLLSPMSATPLSPAPLPALAVSGAVGEKANSCSRPELDSRPETLHFTHPPITRP